MLNSLFGGAGPRHRTSKPKARTRLGLEVLEARDCPAVATWTHPGMGNNTWADAANWNWSVPAMNVVNYPGDTPGRMDDEVVFSGGAQSKLMTGATLQLKSLQVTNGYMSQISLLNGSDIVIQGNNHGFDMGGGSLILGAGSELNLHSAAGAPNNPIVGPKWWAGLITGAGSINVGTNFYIYSAASSLGADLHVTQNGTVQIDTVGNLALSGPSNGITVTNNGKLSLHGDATPANAYQSGGIVGGAGHLIQVMGNGILERGDTDQLAGGALLVDVPVMISDHGKLIVRDGNLGSATGQIKFGSSLGGYGLTVTGHGSIYQEADTIITATNGVLLNSGYALYEVEVSAGSSALLEGRLSIPFGKLSLVHAAATYGAFSVNGNVTFGDFGTLQLNAEPGFNDALIVGGWRPWTGPSTWSGPARRRTPGCRSSPPPRSRRARMTSTRSCGPAGRASRWTTSSRPSAAACSTSSSGRASPPTRRTDRGRT